MALFPTPGLCKHLKVNQQMRASSISLSAYQTNKLEEQRRKGRLGLQLMEHKADKNHLIPSKKTQITTTTYQTQLSVSVPML